jgi:hypothetical protein
MDKEIVKVCKVHGELTVEFVKKTLCKGKFWNQCLICRRNNSKRNGKLYIQRYGDSKRYRDMKSAIDKRYRIKNKENIKNSLNKWRSKNRATVNKWSNTSLAFYRKNLYDSYVKKVIISGTNLTFSDIPQEFVELYRTTLLLKREAKNASK